MMIKYITLYILTVPVFFVIDMLWLGVVARDFYRTQLADFLGPTQWVPGITFYLLFIVGILVFAVLPALAAGTVWRAVLLGAFFGFIAYATYDLTNMATLPNWPLKVVIVDMLWGAVLSGSVATASYFIAKYLGV